MNPEELSLVFHLLNVWEQFGFHPLCRRRFATNVTCLYCTLSTMTSPCSRYHGPTHLYPCDAAMCYKVLLRESSLPVGPVLRAAPTFSPSSLRNCLHHGHSYPTFASRTTEPQRGNMTCSRPFSFIGNSRWQSRPVCFQNLDPWL